MLANLFHEHHFVTYAAQQSGSCGRRMKHCRYAVSLMRLPFNDDAIVLPKFTSPVAGLGNAAQYV
jgi:hypothetical protein